MKPLLQLNNIKNLSLRGIDEKVERLAKSGFGGAVIPFAGDWEALKGWCRSAYRHGVGLWLRDDCGPVSGSGDGEVTSVPEFRPKRFALINQSELQEDDVLLRAEGESAVVIRYGGDFWGADPFNPYAAEAFLDGFYRGLKREVPRFLGHEIQGIVTRFSAEEQSFPHSEYLTAYILEKYGINIEENAASLFLETGNFQKIRRCYREAANTLFAETCLKRIHGFCHENGMLLVGLSAAPISQAEKYIDIAAAEKPLQGAKMLFADFSGLSFSQRLREINAAFAQGIDSIAVSADLFPAYMEEIWTSAAERMFALSEGSTPCPVELEDLPSDISVCRAQRKDGDLYFLANTGENEVKAELSAADIPSGCIFDAVGGKTYFINVGENLRLTLAAGGSLALVQGAENTEAELMPPFTASGAVLCKFSKPVSISLELTEIESNVLPLSGSGRKYVFEAQYAEGEMYVEAEGAAFVKLNGSDVKAPEFNITSMVRMGENILDTDGENPSVRGDIFTDGERITPPRELTSGDVRSQGMPCYDGFLKYAALLPDDCGEKYLWLDGSFNCAFVKIGRRKERLITAPFMIPLFSSDGGRTAEIVIFPAHKQNSVPFGLNYANIVSTVK
ncbi:MAG: hypothetical protein ACI4SS_06855 [Clostridia bacterium]